LATVWPRLHAEGSAVTVTGVFRGGVRRTRIWLNGTVRPVKLAVGTAVGGAVAVVVLPRMRI
jgi:hypothetical protein